MTEYVATRWYRAPEVMLCGLPATSSPSKIADAVQRSKSIQSRLIYGLSDASWPR